jgi:thiamine pyrophosphokinase
MMWWTKKPVFDFALIVADGDPPSLELIRNFREQARAYFALDGAANWLLEQNEVPDLIIGDLDSFDRNKWPKIPILCIADQNSNDLEKALVYCQEQGINRAIILGAFGRRLDHLLTNLFVLRKFNEKLAIMMADDTQMAFIAKPGQTLELLDMKDEYLSLFPCGNNVGPVTTTGVQYGLKKECLSFDQRIGTLNRIIENRATIHNERGDLLIIMPNRTVL